MESVSVLGVRIDAATKQSLRCEVARMLRGDELSIVAKVNSEFLVRAAAEPAFAAYLAGTDLSIADGIGVLWAARFLTLETTQAPVLRSLQIFGQAAYSLASLMIKPGYCREPLPERVPGVEALHAMLEAAEETGASVFFLGAGLEVNERARKAIAGRYPRLRIAGGRDGYRSVEGEAVGEIEESGASLLVVALGSPKQEYWIRDHRSGLRCVRVAVGEGGSLDFIAGDFRRAPVWMQEMGLEWLWRLFMNESRSTSGNRALRVWNAVPVFIWRVVRWKLEHGFVRSSGTERP
jgi:N-acetylglucosaminyldiphosphoundecaprenol N-acetyl-beta-D-mannosaminyltransferase